MMRHIVLVRWMPGATPSEKEAVQQAISALPSQVPEIRSMQCGADVGGTPNSCDFAAVMDFDDRDAFRRYLQSAAHKAYVEGPGKIAVASLAVVQHLWDQAEHKPPMERAVQ